MLWAQWGLGLCPNPGAVLCCVYASPLLQVPGQEGLAQSRITSQHFCLDAENLAFMASLCVSFFMLGTPGSEVLGLMIGEFPLTIFLL